MNHVRPLLVSVLGLLVGCAGSAADDAEDPGDALSELKAPATATSIRRCPAPSGRTITVATTGGDVRKVQAGLDAARAGDVVLVKAGTYHESVSFPRSGTPAGCITLKGESGAVLDGAGAGGNVGIRIENRSWVAVVGMTVQGYRGGDTPTGIKVAGGQEVVELRQNKVTRIESSQDAHGISFHGTASTPMRDVLVDGNEVSSCKLGSSESLVLNGNISGFVVSHNTVHDNDNIGIDFIGFEGTGPSGQDQVRDGSCVDNVVYGISSKNNPAYDGELAADGIYVDGGKNITIERNRVSRSDIGIEIASEHGGRTTSDITVRNNFVSGSVQGNIMVGGYDANRGSAKNIAILHNTLFQGKGGEVVVQHNTSALTVMNNVFVARAGAAYVSATGGNNSNVKVDTNLYFGASTSSAGTWRDAKARFANPKLVGGPNDLHLGAGSPARDAGAALGERAGTSDVDGEARVRGAAPDLGADEAG